MSLSTDSETYEFTLKSVDPSLSADEVRELLETAVQEAVEAITQEGKPVEAQAEIKGAFAGIGETAVILLIAFLKGAAGGAGAVAGKTFFERYLKPRLQKRNLVASGLEKREPASGGT